MVLVVALVFVPMAANAVPITYTLATAGGTGSLGTASFSGAEITFTATADTANVQEFIAVPFTAFHGRTFYANYSVVPLVTLSVMVGGLPAATFLDPPQMRYVYTDSIYFSDSSGQGYAGYDVPTPPSSPDHLSDFTTAPVILSNSPFVGTESTTQGAFSLASTGLTTVFSADPGTPIPEPRAVTIIGLALLGLILASTTGPRRRANRRSGSLLQL